VSGISMQNEERMLSSKQLEMACKRFKVSLFASLAISSLLVIALWQVVTQGTLLAWLASIWLVTLLRNVDARSYLRLGQGARVEFGKWRTRFVVGSTAAGLCWGMTIFCFPTSPHNNEDVLLIFVIAGVSAFASVSMSTVPSAVIAFLLTSLLPLAVWLFLFGEYLHYFMGTIALMYLGLMQILSHQLHKQISTLLLTTAQNKELGYILQESDQRLSRYLENTPGFFASVMQLANGSCTMPFASGGIHELFGVEADAVMQDIGVFAALEHPDDVEMTRLKTEESARHLTPCHVEYRIIHPQKGMRWIEVRSLPQRTSDGGTLWDGFYHDITERKLLEAELRAHEQEFRTLVERAPEPIFRYAPDGRRTYVNVAGERISGISIDVLLDEPLSDGKIIPANEGAIMTALIRRICETGEPGETEVEHLGADGIRRHFHSRLAPEFDANGKVRSVFSISHDITEHKKSEAELKNKFNRIAELNASLEESARNLEEQAVELEASQEQIKLTEAWYRGIVRSAPDGMVVINKDGNITLVNAQLEAIFGYTEDELLGQPMETLLLADVWQGHITKREGFITSIACWRPIDGVFSDLRASRKDGSVFPVDVSLSRLPNGNVMSGAICVAIRDITLQKHMQDRLSAREQEARTLIENSPDTVSRYNRECRRIYVNPAFAKTVDGGKDALLGRTPSECPGGPNSRVYEDKINEIFKTGVDADLELKWPRRDGKEISSHVRLTAERDTSGNVVSVLAVGRDITELMEHRERIHHMAFYDSLTALPNRALFNDRLRQMLTDTSWHEHLAGVMLLDLDRFKAINDTLGHPAGDELLREAAERLTNCVRAYDTVARFGGDEFAILLPEIRSTDDLGRIANKILEEFNKPFTLEGKEMFVSTSVGISVYPNDSSDADDLVKQADSAMYFAKQSGRNNFRFYSTKLTASASERLSLESELRRAVERNELELYYQPKVWLANGGLIGSEALLRWNNPRRGMVPPDQFISIAEDTGLIVEIGEWVLRNACRVACDWNGPGKPLHRVAINLSGRQFQSGDLVRTIVDILNETVCYPEWIELEITESLLLDENGDVLEILKAFQSIGISIAIDDFGTGYSALSYLTRFPINTLKIDRAFICTITSDNFSAELVKAIISIAHSLNQQVVAEGVETPEQVAILRKLGCQIAQGYLYSQPIQKSEFELLPLSFEQTSVLEEY
jgi:diguanylate cyclase (GGDEF)-like protein/PAS domain S-box-containing protein